MTVDLNAPIEPVRSLRTMFDAVRLAAMGTAAQVERWQMMGKRPPEEIQIGRIRVVQLTAAADLGDILARHPDMVRAIVEHDKTMGEGHERSARNEGALSAGPGEAGSSRIQADAEA